MTAQLFFGGCALLVAGLVVLNVKQYRQRKLLTAEQRRVEDEKTTDDLANGW